jgi:hypothetical protein
VALDHDPSESEDEDNSSDTESDSDEDEGIPDSEIDISIPDESYMSIFRNSTANQLDSSDEAPGEVDYDGAEETWQNEDPIDEVYPELPVLSPIPPLLTCAG